MRILYCKLHFHNDLKFRFLNFVCVCIMCVCVRVHFVHVPGPVYTCTFECLSVETTVQCGVIAFHLIFGNGVSLSFQITSRLDDQRALGICLSLCISTLGLQMHVATLGFCMGAGDLNSGSHTLFSRHCTC